MHKELLTKMAFIYKIIMKYISKLFQKGRDKMKKVRIWMALVLCMTLIMSVAGAEEYLNARIDGNTLKVS